MGVGAEGMVGRDAGGHEPQRWLGTRGAAWRSCAGGSCPGFRTTVPPGSQVRTKDVLFESISHLISHHRQNEQPIVAAESELHLRQVVQRKQ